MWKTIERKGVIKMDIQKKTAMQIGLLLLAFGMIGYGIWRGETDIVLGKAIKLCLECVGIG